MMAINYTSHEINVCDLRKFQEDNSNYNKMEKKGWVFLKYLPIWLSFINTSWCERSKNNLYKNTFLKTAEKNMSAKGA